MKSPCSKIDKLPEEVLLEIFDSYRRVLTHDVYELREVPRHQYEHLLVPIYERQWNRKHGWFKLVHVCRKWRRIVLASPSRLDLSLVLIKHNPGKMQTVYTPRLPPIPIRIDYDHSFRTMTNKDIDRVVAALRQRDRRVRGIVFKGGDLQQQQLEKVFKAMKRPFPSLERLEIYRSSLDDRKLQIPPTFLRGSAPRLRRLKLFPVSFKSISQLLSSATVLVELSLSIDTIFGSSPTESLLAHLQAMPCLRWLALKLRSEMSHNDRILSRESCENGGKVFPLSQLTFLYFNGHRLFLNSLLSGLAVPSIQNFDIQLRGYPDNLTSPIQHISRFIADINTEPEAFKFRVIFLKSGYFSLSLLAQYESIDESIDDHSHFHFNSPDVMQISNALSPKLATVEELFLASFHNSSPPRTPWRKFLRLFNNAKVLRLQHNVMFDIAHSLQDQGNSTSVLPSLEEIELSTGSWSWTQDERRSAMSPFEPFIAARQRAGRPVKIFMGARFGVTGGFPQDFLS